MAIPKLHIWLDVPDGSTLEMEASGKNADGSPNDNFDISVDLFSSGDDDEEFFFDDLVSGPAVKTLRTPNMYSGSLLLEFAGEPVPSVTFTARVVDPGGVTQPIDYTFTEDDGSVEHRSMLLIGMQGGAL